MTRKVSFLIFSGFQILDVSGPLAVFEAANNIVSGNGETASIEYDIEILSVDGGGVESSSGARLDSKELKTANSDTLMVSGGVGTRNAIKDVSLLNFIRSSSKIASRICSVCSGSLILAAAGMLNGKQATTHWASAHYFEKLFPEVLLSPDKIYVQDGNIWTSAGVTAGIDLALALVTEDLGETVGREVAQELVVYYNRPGGQSQFSPLLNLSMKESRFDLLLSWVRQNLECPLHVEALADKMGMSPRNFSRLFKKELDMTPAKAVERIRMDVAKVRIEQGGVSFDIIAVETGFTNADHMRRTFVRELGIAPQSLRQFAKLSDG